MDSDTALFVRRACQTPPLTPEQERDAFARVAAGDADARHLVVSSNVRLLVALAKKFENREVPADDLIQCGVVALYSAVDRFQVGRGVKFSTYATNWVLKEFLVLLKSTSIIGVPAHLWSLDGPVPPAVLKILSLDDPMRASEEDTSRSVSLGDVVPDEAKDEDAPGAEEEREDRRELLRRAVKRLSPGYRAAIILRFGLIEGTEPMKEREVAEQLGISIKAVEQRIYKAMEKIPGLMIEEKD